MLTASPAQRPILVGAALLGSVLLVGCASVEPGNGRPAAANTAAETSATDDATQSADPTATTSETASSTSESSDPGQPTPSEDPALAFAIGFQYAAHVNTRNLQLAYELLCADVRAELSFEDFSEGAPEADTLSFDPGEQLAPGRFSGTLTYGEETGEVLIVSDGAGGYCLSEE